MNGLPGRLATWSQWRVKPAAARRAPVWSWSPTLAPPLTRRMSGWSARSGGEGFGGGGAGIGDALLKNEIGVGVGEEGGDERGVRIADLAGGGRGVGGDEFAAGDEVGDAGAAGDERAGGTDGGEQGEGAGVKRGAGSEERGAGEGLGAAAADGAGGGCLVELESGGREERGVLLHDEGGVGGREGTAGEDAQGVAGIGRAGGGGRAGSDGAGDGDGAGGLGGVDEVAVDGGAVEGRLVFGREDGFAEDAMMGRGERDALGGEGRRDEGVEAYPEIGD
jgi:hypothetical protein